MQQIGGFVSAGAVLLGLTVAPSSAEQARPALPPLPYRILQKLHSDPRAWQQFLADHATAEAAPMASQDASATAKPTAPGWTLAFKGLALSNPLLLTNGSVIAHEPCTSNWYRLTPDINGSYEHGSWAATAPMPAGYSPQFFASQILPDGRVLVEGGEYNGTNCKYIESTDGAIYDPVADSWTSVSAPPGWTQIGDASMMVLRNGTVLLASCCTADTAILDPATMVWTATGAGKADLNEEENWTLLPDGNVLTVDANYLQPSECNTNSEVYTTSTGTWTSAGSTIRKLSGCSGKVKTYEAPTQIMSPLRKVWAFGSTASTLGQNFHVPTSIYLTTTGTWVSGPWMPQVHGINYTMADAPAAILPNGEALIAASPSVWAHEGEYPAPTRFFTYGENAFTQVGNMTDADRMSAFDANFLILPTGEVLGVETNFINTDIFPAVCCSRPAWAPRIISISSTTLVAGGSYKLHGMQLSGLTQGASYGEDEQADSNFPLVRITNQATQHVFYGRTYGFVRSVTPDAESSASFDVPNGIESGASSLVVVANGIPSKPISVTVF